MNAKVPIWCLWCCNSVNWESWIVLQMPSSGKIHKKQILMFGYCSSLFIFFPFKRNIACKWAIRCIYIVYWKLKIGQRVAHSVRTYFWWEICGLTFLWNSHLKQTPAASRLIWVKQIRISHRFKYLNLNLNSSGMHDRLRLTWTWCSVPWTCSLRAREIIINFIFGPFSLFSFHYYFHSHITHQAFEDLSISSSKQIASIVQRVLIRPFG